MAHPAFIPPYLLHTLAETDSDASAAAARTLRIDNDFRRRRSAQPEVVELSDLPVDDGTHPSRAIYDAAGGSELPGQQVRLEGEPATGDAAVDEAYDGLGATWSLFAEVYDRDSIDGHGAPLIGTVHFGKDYDNAFWNGEQMVFGDGDGVIFNRFTKAIDVIGHELAHAVTERTTGLIYQGQPGALNESISDVFGSLVKQRLLGQTAAEADWLIGAGLLAEGVNGVAIRSMSHPGTAYDDPRLGKDPQPASMSDYVETKQDNGGVHLNSGIPNRAFYLVATALGGNAWEAPGQIWYDTLLGNIKPDCDFQTFAALTEQAAATRYGAGSTEAQAVRQAWESVGVTGTALPATAAKPLPASGSLRITRTGGFAGLSQERVVDLASLPAEVRQEWSLALRHRDLVAGSEVQLHADGFCYEISCSHPALDLELPEQAMPPLLRTLVDDLWSSD